MRAFYVITYDLKVVGRDYSSLYSAIKTFEEWQHPLESTWLVFTEEDANNIYKKLKPTLDDSDLIFIAELNINNRQGWMSKSCWDWINSKIGQL